MCVCFAFDRQGYFMSACTRHHHYFIVISNTIWAMWHSVKFIQACPSFPPCVLERPEGIPTAQDVMVFDRLEDSYTNPEHSVDIVYTKPAAGNISIGKGIYYAMQPSLPYTM